MAAAYGSSAKTAWSSNTTLTVTKPTGTVDGDVLAVSVDCETLAAITGPAGWTKQHDKTFSGSVDLRQTVWTKVASSEGASWNWTVTGGAWSGAIAIRVTGADTASPVDAIGAGDTGDLPGGPMTASSISPAGSDSLLLYFGMDYNNTTPHTAPSGMSNQSGALDNVESIAYTQALSSSGATGTRAPGVDATGGWTAVLVAIKSAGGAATPTIDMWGPKAQAARGRIVRMVPSGFTPPLKAAA